MFDYHSTIQLYAGSSIEDTFPGINRQIIIEISTISEIILFETKDTELSETLTKKYYLDFPVLHFDQVYVTNSEKSIPAERFPFDFDVERGKSYKKDIIVYHIPYSGDVNILTYRPNPFSSRIGSKFPIDRQNSCILLEIVNFYNDSEKIKKSYEELLRNINSDYNYLKSNCEGFNNKLKENILTFISQRKEQLNEKSKLLADLGVPVKVIIKNEKPVPIPLESKPNKIKIESYDLAISFSGEDRKIAEEIATHLTKLGYTIFYDRYEQANLWGKDLYGHLNEVYSKKARFCLMIISKNYANKHWTNHERKAAQAKAFTQNEEYILPLRLDETEIPGLNSTVGYIDYNKTGLMATLELLQEKMKK